MGFKAVMLIAALVLPGAAAASDADRLLDLVGVTEVIEIMREEGVDYGEQLAADMLPGGGDPGWRSTVERIYDPQRMEALVRDRFRAATEGADLGPLIDFFDSERGRRIVGLEVSARRALVDEEVEDAARRRFRELEAADDARVRLVSAYVEANDLVEANVAGALNASYQFYSGLVQGGVLRMGEEEILRDVWAQEAETRADTREWIYAYLLMAYQPLEPELMQEYIDLSRTEAGQVMNRALFDGFNAMYDTISFALGLAVAREMASQDI